MVWLKSKKDFDASELESGEAVLGYKNIHLLFNAGPFPGGGDCLIVEADGTIETINSNDLIHDLEAYEISK